MWSVIKGYPKYVISHDGIILSSSRGFREVKPYKDKDGYLQVTLSSKNVRKRWAIHRLVALHFILPNGKNVVNHINSVRDDNDVRNLEWVTVQENNAHGIEFGFLAQKGADNKNSKLTDAEVYEIKSRIAQGEQYKSIAKDYSVTAVTIGRIGRKENWTHL